MTATNALEVRDISFGYNARLLLKDISFSVAAGELIALIGPNGSGKTTLLKIMLGLLHPNSGAINLNGQALSTLEPKARAKSIAYVSQQPPLSFPLTVRELVALGRYPYGMRGRETPTDKVAIEIALEKTVAQELCNRQFNSLSGGETLQFGVPGKRPVIRKSSSSSSQANGQLSIVTHRSPAHPREGVMLYRIEYRGKTLVYATDVEQRAGGYADIIDFAQGADMLIHDAQYLHAEYHSKTKSKKGWGHSTIEMAAEVATKAQVKKLVLFHHEPQHDDPAMRRIARLSKELFPESIVAYQGLELKLL